MIPEKVWRMLLGHAIGTRHASPWTKERAYAFAYDHDCLEFARDLGDWAERQLILKLCLCALGDVAYTTLVESVKHSIAADPSYSEWDDENVAAPIPNLLFYQFLVHYVKEMALASPEEPRVYKNPDRIGHNLDEVSMEGAWKLCIFRVGGDVLAYAALRDFAGGIRTDVFRWSKERLRKMKDEHQQRGLALEEFY